MKCVGKTFFKKLEYNGFEIYEGFLGTRKFTKTFVNVVLREVPQGRAVTQTLRKSRTRYAKRVAERLSKRGGILRNVLQLVEVAA